MNKKQLTVAWTVLMLLAGSAVAEQSKNAAQELQLKEEDFTYNDYKDSLKLIRDIIDRYEKGGKYDPKSELSYIGIPNSLLRLEGYGLIAQRNIALLKLENAKLKDVTRGEIFDLESKLKEAEKQLQNFLKHNIWVD